MAIPQEQRQRTLDEAVAQLERDPSHPVSARVGELDVEIRVVGRVSQRNDGGSAEPPENL